MLPEGRADVDDGGLRLRAQPWQQSLREPDGRFQVDRQYFFDGGPALLLQQAEAADAGVVDEHVDPEVPSRGGSRGNAFAPGQVGLQGRVVRPGRNLDFRQPLGIAAGQQ